MNPLHLNIFSTRTLDFNENRVGGTDPLTANLTAVFAYYAYIILGLNFDSYGLRGGDLYFQKAQNIVNNAPETNAAQRMETIRRFAEPLLAGGKPDQSKV